MSSEVCTETDKNEECQPLQTAVCCLFVNMEEAIQDTEAWFQKSRECGCETCIEYIRHLQKRIGPLVETIGSYHKKLTKVIDNG